MDDAHDVLDTVRVVMQPRVVVAQVATSIGTAALATSALGLRTLGVRADVIVVATAASLALYLATYAWARWRKITHRWPLAELNAIAIVLCSVAFSAPSHFAATPAYGLVVGTGFVLGLVGGSTRGLGPTLALSPLVFRLAFAPAPSALSLAISAAVGVIAWWSYRLGTRRWQDRLDVRRALVAERERFAATRTRVAQVAMAMSLHDGVTGLFLALQRRLQSTDTVAGLEPALRRATDRVHEALRPLPTRPPADWGRALGELGDEFGVTITWRCDPPGARIAAALSSDLWAIVWEAMANALAHGESPVAVTLVATPNEVTLTVDTPARAAPQRSGNGLNHIQLLADSWGGRVHVEHDAVHHHLAVVLPIPVDAAAADATWRWLFGPLLGVAVAGLAGAIDGHVPVLVVGLVLQAVTAMTTLSIYLQVRNMARTSRQARVRAVESVLDECRATLQPLVERLEASTDRGDLAAVRQDVDALFRAVSALTRTLENVHHSSDAS